MVHYAFWVLDKVIHLLSVTTKEERSPNVFSLDSIIPLSPSSVQVFLTTSGFSLAFIWLGYLFKPFVWVVCKNYLDYLIKSSQKLSILLQKTFGSSLICWSNFWNYCKRFFFWLSIFTAVWLKGICCSYSPYRDFTLFSAVTLCHDSYVALWIVNHLNVILNIIPSLKIPWSGQCLEPDSVFCMDCTIQAHWRSHCPV